MLSVLWWTIKMRKLSTIWWSVGIALFIFINLIFYPSFKDEADQLQQSFENIPDAALQLLGGSTDFFSPVGYVNSQVFFLMLPLLLGILAISLGSRLLAQEEQDKTIESLLSRPLSRGQLLAAKALSGVAILSIVTLVSWVAIITISSFVGLEVGITVLTYATLVCYLLVISFGAIAYALTASGKARGSSIGIATLVAFGGYIIGSLSATVSWLELPSKVLPFNYYQSEAILRDTYNWANVVYFIILIGLCATISWIVFRRRDLA